MRPHSRILRDWRTALSHLRSDEELAFSSMLRKCVVGVTFISFVVLGCSLAFYFLYWPKVQQRNAALIAHILEEGAATYKNDYDAYPSGSGTEIIATLLGQNSRNKSYLRPEFRAFLNDDGSVSDSWNRPFRFDSQSDGGFKLRSAGPNGVFDDADDLTSANAHE